jgi:hypothetical protein
VTTPATGARPTVGQALVILLAAVVLAVSGCFGAFGFGVGSGNALQSFALLAVLPVILFAMVGFLIGAARLVRAIAARRSAANIPAAAPLPQAPGFGQTVAIFFAGVAVLSGACMGLTGAGYGASDLGTVLFTLVFVAGVAAAAAGFALMLWPRRAATAPVEATPPTATGPGMEPRA